MTLPYWLFDELADRTDDLAELRAALTAWDELLAGAEEIDGAVVEYTRLAGTDKPTTVRLAFGAAERLARYAELRRRAARPTPFDRQMRTDYWGPAVEPPEPDETVYVTPARAAEITGLHPATLLAERRRGRLRSIGMTPGEYKRARALAGWAAGEQGWAPKLFYLREDVERLAHEGRRAA